MIDAVTERQAGVLGQMPRLAVHRNDDVGPDPFVHFDQLGPTGMPGNVNVGLLLGDNGDAEVGQLVHDPANRGLVARNDPRREDDRVAFGQFEVVCP